MTHVIEFFEKLPFAYIQDLKIKTSSLVLLFFIIFMGLHAVIKRKSNSLKLALCSILVLILIHLPEKFDHKDKLIVYNKPKSIEIKWNIGKYKFKLDTISDYQFIDIQNKRFLALKYSTWQAQLGSKKLNLDYLYLSGTKAFSIEILSQLFDIKKIILDASMPEKHRTKISIECNKLHISCYDIKKRELL